MVDIETLIVLTLNAIIAGVASITFGIACKKQKNLRSWLFSYIFLAIGNVLDIFQFGNLLITLLAIIIFALAAVFFFIATFLEYYKIFIKTQNQNLAIRDKFTVVLVIGSIFLGVYIFIIIMLFISTIMLFRIYMKNHSATKLFLLITSISAMICIIALYISYFGIEGAYFFSNILVTFFVTLMLSTSFVALLEQKIIDTLNEKDILKDKYSHDLGNILQAISISYDLINRENHSSIKSDELDTLIKNKVNEASKLVKSIRDLH